MNHKEVYKCVSVCVCEWKMTTTNLVTTKEIINIGSATTITITASFSIVSATSISSSAAQQTQEQSQKQQQTRKINVFPFISFYINYILFNTINCFISANFRKMTIKNLEHQLLQQCLQQLSFNDHQLTFPTHKTKQQGEKQKKQKSVVSLAVALFKPPTDTTVPISSLFPTTHTTAIGAEAAVTTTTAEGESIEIPASATSVPSKYVRVPVRLYK